MKRLLLVLLLLTGCATVPNLEKTGSATGLGASPFSTGGSFTAAHGNALNDGINDNDSRLDTIEALTGPVFSDGDGTYTDMSAIDATEFGYLNGVTSAIQTQLNAKQASDADLTTWAGITPSANLQTFLATPNAANFETAIGAGAFASDLLGYANAAAVLSGIGAQASDATLTDIADGTITEDLVNTANPWGPTEGGTGADTSAMNGIPLMTLGVISAATESTDYFGPAGTTHTHPNGHVERVATTTDGHTLIKQAYDTNGATWRAAITIENGDSSNADANNWPRVHIGENVALTGLGNASLGLVWGSEVSVNPTVTADSMNQMYPVVADVTATLPAVSTVEYGDWIEYKILDAGSNVTVDCDGSDKINYNGIAKGAGVHFIGSGLAGSIIRCTATTDADSSGTDGWMCEEKLGGQIYTASKAANYTIGTDTEAEKYGGVFYVTSAATITASAICTGCSFSVITVGAIAVSVDSNASDKFMLDGTALDDGDKITNTSTSGDTAVCTYYSADGWLCITNAWTDGGA